MQKEQGKDPARYLGGSVSKRLGSIMSEGFFQRLVESVADAVYVHDGTGRIVEVNPAACRQTGFSRDELLGMTISDLNPFRTPDELDSILAEVSGAGRTSHVFRGVHRRQDGSDLSVEVNLTPIRYEGRSLFLAAVRDISNRVRLEQDLDDRVAFDRLLLDISTRLVNVQTDKIDQVINDLLADIGHFFGSGRTYVFSIDHANKCFSNTHEWYADGVAPEIDNLQQVGFDDFPWLMERILNNQVAHIPDVAKLPDSVAHERIEYQRQRIRSLVIVPLVRSGKVRGLFGLDAIWEKRYWPSELRDNLRLLGQLIASAMDAASLGDKLKHLAYHDALTHLPNRQLLKDRIAQAAHHCARENTRMVVMLLDLDDFKLVNDTLTHSAGDELLCTIADRLRGIIREGDTVARLGGDEFVLVAQLSETMDAAGLAARALEAVSAPVTIQGESIVTHPSIGVCIFPDDDPDHEKLLANADLAMYAAKGSGKNRFAFFDPSMTEKARDTLNLRYQLEEAMQSEQLRLHFQPRVDLRTRKTCGLEALVRWQHPERGLLGPGEFLPLAERSDLICRVDHWVLKRCPDEVGQWGMGDSPVRIAVNLSARDLYDSPHVESLLGIIETYYVVPGISLELEITESMLMHDIHAAIQVLNSIKSRFPGIHIAIDDFGSGYSSLNYLRQLPIDTLKIDRAFIFDLGREQRNSEAIVRSVIDLGRNLNLRVVAEGVETEFQRDVLIRLGCDEAQGFLFSRPLPSEELTDLPGFSTEWFAEARRDIIA